MSVTVISQVIAILALAGWAIYKEIREANKSKKYNLMENPERCHDHEERLRSIEKECAATAVQLAVINTKIADVVRRIDNISDLFNNSGDRI